MYLHSISALEAPCIWVEKATMYSFKLNFRDLLELWFFWNLMGAISLFFCLPGKQFSLADKILLKRKKIFLEKKKCFKLELEKELYVLAPETNF